MRGCSDYGLQQVILFAGSEKAVLPFEYAVIEKPVARDSDTDSGDFTSDSEADCNDEELGERDLVDALAGDIEDLIDTYAEVSTSDEDRRHAFLTAKEKNLENTTQRKVASMLKGPNSIAWSLKDFSPADVRVKHHFELKENVPIHSRPRRMVPKHNEFIKKELDNLLDAGIIVPSSCAWFFPVVIASKKDGTPRICVNYRSLTGVMKADGWPLPRNEEILDNFQEYSVFTTLDLFGGNLQVQMTEACKAMTTFVIPHVNFQFKEMSFGLMIAHSTFQRMVDVVLQGVHFARVHKYDMGVFSPSTQ